MTLVFVIVTIVKMKQWLVVAVTTRMQQDMALASYMLTVAAIGDTHMSALFEFETADSMPVPERQRQVADVSGMALLSKGPTTNAHRLSYTIEVQRSLLTKTASGL